jgi:Fe-Mn family superoxide dismutase
MRIYESMPTSLRRVSRSLALILALYVCALSATNATESAPFALPELPYAVDALEPAIDAETMRIHHGRHHRAYVDNLNAKTKDFPQLNALSLEQLQREISSFDSAVRNNGGGHYNHSLFWTLLAPPGQGGAPSAALKARIERDFGSVEDMQKRFDADSRSVFGSGWAWLILRDDGSLAITTTPNQDNPLMDLVAERGTPLLALDVWEHAYYLKHQNKRADYIAAWWQVANWMEANRRFADAKGSDAGAATGAESKTLDRRHWTDRRDQRNSSASLAEHTSDRSTRHADTDFCEPTHPLEPDDGMHARSPVRRCVRTDHRIRFISDTAANGAAGDGHAARCAGADARWHHAVRTHLAAVESRALSCRVAAHALSFR